MRSLLILSGIILISINSFSQGFNCDGRLYFFRDIGANGYLSCFDNYPGSTTVIDLCPLPGYSHNGLAANPLDSLLYYLDGNSIRSIDANFNSNIICPNIGFGSVSGACDNLGRYWTVTGNNLLAIDLNTCSVVKGPFPLPAGSLDIAYNPYDCHIYIHSSGNNNIFKLDTNGVTVANFQLNFTPGGTYGGTAFGSDGLLYGVADGNLSSIDFQNLTSNFVFSYSPGVTNGRSDMASFGCIDVTASFQAAVINSCDSSTFQFTDSSNGYPVPVNYWLWDFGDNSTSPARNPVHTYTSPGTYTVSLIVASSTGCNLQVFDTAMTTITVNQLNSSSVSYTSCTGSFTLPGGSTVYSSGTYVDSLMSVNGCDSIITVNLTVSGPLSVTATASTIICFGENSELIIQATGGTAPYSGTGSYQVSAGTYTYTVTDANGCSATTGAISITQPTLLSVIASVSSTTAAGSPSGSATAVATGGTPGYAYSWNTVPAQNTATASGLYSGSYSVIVTDSRGCTTATSVIVPESALQCSTFRAFQQGRWGSTAAAAGPGVYLASHFASAYPNGLLIGSCGRTIRLTTSAAVSAFLPSSGNSRQLSPITLVNPSRNSYSNSMAGELVALNLNITFDSLDAAFAPSGVFLKNAIITHGPFTNWTVQRLYDEANRVIGCGGTASYINDLTNALVRVNSTGNEGNGATPYLRCPDRSTRTTNPLPPQDEVNVFPSPTSGNATIRYTMEEPGIASVEVFNTTGELVYTSRESVTNAGEHTLNLPLKNLGLPGGLYFIRFFRNETVEDLRLVISN